MTKTLESVWAPTPPQEKVCTKCGESKPVSEYTKHKLGRDGLRPRCRACIAVEAAKYRAKTVEQRAAYNKKYRLEHREQHLAYNREWNKANPGRTREALARYRTRHAARLKVAKALRRKVSAGERQPEKVLARIELYGGCCYYCGLPATTIDHRIPICRGGSNLPANLVPACVSCNSRKRHRTESEWRGVASPL